MCVCIECINVVLLPLSSDEIRGLEMPSDRMLCMNDFCESSVTTISYAL